MFSPPVFRIYCLAFLSYLTIRVEKHTADNNILSPVLDLRASVRVHDGQVARVQGAAREHLPGGLGVLVVALAADVAEEDDLADLLAVLRYVDEHSFGLFRLDHADRKARQEAVPLPGHLVVLFFPRERVPVRHRVPLGDRAVRLGQAVDVNGVQV